MKNIAIFLSFIFLIGCDVITNSASVRFRNESSDAYQLFIDDKPMERIEANTFIDHYVNAGHHTFKVVQSSGYLVSPTEYTKEITIETGHTLEWSWRNLLLP